MNIIMNAEILAPAAVLVAWTMTILIWMTITRFVAIGKSGMSLSDTPAGARYNLIEDKMPPKVNWVSHNYTHLVEQPTLFYATVAILALAGAGSGINATLAWAYAGIRIVHSLWQLSVNTLPIRIALFMASSVCLIALVVNAVCTTLF